MEQLVAKRLKQLLPILCLIFLAGSLNPVNAQTTIYSEDFCSYSNGTTSSSSWSLDLNGCSTDSDTYFEVRNGAFEGQDLDCEFRWLSSSINISSYSSITVEVDVYETGSNETSDYISVYYSIDGGSEVQFPTNGYLDDDFTSATASTTISSGSSLQIIVYMRNSQSSENHGIDEVRVTGTGGGGGSNLFTEMASAKGLALNTPKDGGFTFADFNNDVYLDCVVNTESTNSTSSSRLYFNSGPPSSPLHSLMSQKPMLTA